MVTILILNIAFSAAVFFAVAGGLAWSIMRERPRLATGDPLPAGGTPPNGARRDIGHRRSAAVRAAASVR